MLDRNDGAGLEHATLAHSKGEGSCLSKPLSRSFHRAGQNLASEHVNHYVTDGEVMAASLVVEV